MFVLIFIASLQDWGPWLSRSSRSAPLLAKASGAGWSGLDVCLDLHFNPPFVGSTRLVSPTSSLSHHEHRMVFPEDSDWGSGLDRSTSLAAGRSFNVTGGHRPAGSDVGLDLYLGFYARQVWQSGPALIFVLTFISPSKWMTQAVAKGCAGTRALTRLTQLSIPERGQSIDFAVRAPRLRGGARALAKRGSTSLAACRWLVLPPYCHHRASLCNQTARGSPRWGEAEVYVLRKTAAASDRRLARSLTSSATFDPALRTMVIMGQALYQHPRRYHPSFGAWLGDR